MINHIFLDKCNTIIENSEINTGLNPVAELNTGDELTRILLYFDLTKLRESVLSNEINVNNLKHKIKMTNCGNINLPLHSNEIFSNCSMKKRATSFDIIAFKIPFKWDEGIGFDYNGDYAKETHKITSTDASNWFQARNDMEWDEHGVYFLSTLQDNFKKYLEKSDDSIIVGCQHFDNGMENLEIDITDYINKVLIENIEFHGIGLSFSPDFEVKTNENIFVSFFTNHTNTFFQPYLETINSNTIKDDRASFHLGVENKLYFFVSDNGEPLNLDELPTCKINEKTYEVKQNGKGNYYIEVFFSKKDVEENTILTDIWSNIKLNGENLDDVEMEFVVLPLEKKISIGNYKTNNIALYPQLSGINDNEHIKIGDIREVKVDFIEEFSYGKKHIPTDSYFRIYVKENNREIDIFGYQQLERKYDEHSFIINTNEMIPNTYYVDIKTKQCNTIKHFNEVLKFSLVNNVTNFYK